MDELLIISLISELLQKHGAKKGITKVSYDGDNDSGSFAFNFNNKSFIISNQSVIEISSE